MVLKALHLSTGQWACFRPKRAASSLPASTCIAQQHLAVPHQARIGLWLGEPRSRRSRRRDPPVVRSNALLRSP